MLKLFVWENVLEDWEPGIAFAFAETAEQAKDLITNNLIEQKVWGRDSAKHWNGLMLDGVSPKIIDSPRGWGIMGGS